VKRLLVDVNVVFDALMERSPHSHAAARLWSAIETQRVEALVPAHGVTTLFYLAARAKGTVFARRAVGAVLSAFGVAAVDGFVIQRAVSLDWRDFEDAVCAAAAEASGCDVIVTRDTGGFPGCALPVMSAETAVSLLEGTPPDRVSDAPKRRHRAARRRARRPAAAA
jgi:predicted nucleic acid-binding protein